MSKGIKDILQKQRQNNNSSICLQINVNLESNQDKVANIFNDYFANIAEKLVEKIKPTSKSHLENLLMKQHI